MSARDTRISIQRLLHVTADGDFGRETRGAFDRLAVLDDDAPWPPLPVVVPTTHPAVTQAALDLIIRFETGGRDYYEKVYHSGPHWPGGASGVTIGAGYDLGYESTFAADWAEHLAHDDFARLERCLGKRRQVAKQAMSGVRGIVIPWDKAIAVFTVKNLPHQVELTKKAFPRAEEKLSRNAFGALVSLVFNRGTDTSATPRRAEMRAIQSAIASPAMGGARLHEFIAAELRAMKRLWRDDPDSDQDLVDRREAEALLVLS